MRRLTNCGALIVGAFCLVWVISCTPAAAQSSQVLDCENATNPRGVTVMNPHLSWTSGLASNPNQYAYQILVASSAEKLKANEGDVWDSGEVISDQRAAQYQGKPLSSLQHYYWKVRVWSFPFYGVSAYSDPASWTTGLLFYDNRDAK